MEIVLPRGDDGELYHAIVKKQATDVDGKPYGVNTGNPLTNSRRYEVEFLDGTTEVLATNIIATNLLAQVDEEGHRQMMLDETIDHRKNNDAIDLKDGLYTTQSGKISARLLPKDGSCA